MTHHHSVKLLNSDCSDTVKKVKAKFLIKWWWHEIGQNFHRIQWKMAAILKLQVLKDDGIENKCSHIF
jgi:hypothetical protein